MRQLPPIVGTRAASAALVAGQLLACGEPTTPPVVYDLVEGLAVARAERERTVVDVGATSSRPFLERGFSWSERDGDGRSFAWSEGEVSVVSFELYDAAEPRIVLLRGFPFAGGADGERPREVDVELNSEPLGSVALAPGVATYQLDAPPSALRIGTNRLELRYPGSLPATTTQGPGRRRRRFAVAWDALALLPRNRSDAVRSLDEILASDTEPAVPRLETGRAEMHLPPGVAVTWTLDLGPGAELRLDDLRAPRAPGSWRLAVWLIDDHAARQLGTIDASRAARSARFPLGLVRFGTVRLSLAVVGGDDSEASDATFVVGEAKIYDVDVVSLLSESHAGPHPADSRARDAPPG